jgi:hypothetical protein
LRSSGPWPLFVCYFYTYSPPLQSDTPLSLLSLNCPFVFLRF